VTLGEEGGVVLYVNGMPAGQLWGEVSEADAKVVTFVTEKEITNSGKYMLYVAPATFVDADGNTNEEMMLNYQVKAAVNSFTYAYVTPAQHQVQKSLKVLTIGFIGEVQDVVSSKSINVVDAEGKTVTTAKLGLDDYDWNAVIVTFKDEITAPGQYSITIPEEYVFSFEQTYNPEFTLTFTIEGEKPAAKPLEIVSVDPAKGSVIEKFDMVKVTFNQEVRVNKMFGAEYFFNGTYIADAGVYVDPTDPKTVIIDTQGEYKNKGTWGFSVQQGTIVTLDGTECESFELTYEVADITGINGIFAEHKNDVYTLDGRKVVVMPGQKIKKGLYIVGGKKVYVK
jgi:methionine-rich copper-binding protein CopC